MRLLVVSNLYPPIVRGGYEVECGEVVEALSADHEITVVTSSYGRSHGPPAPAGQTVLRELDLLPVTRMGTVRAPWAAVRGARTMRQVIERVAPDLAFVWNAAGLPSSALRVLADANVPIAYRICEQWFGGLYTTDQYMRYLQPGTRGRDRMWGAVVRVVSRLSGLGENPVPPLPGAIAWASEALRISSGVPAAVIPVLERTILPATRRIDTLLNLERVEASIPQIAFLGRLEPAKGADIAVRALAYLRDEHGIDAKLSVTGPSTPGDRARLERAATSAGVSSAVDIRPPVDADGLITLFAQSSLLVVPSVWEEPLGMVLLEGAAAGIPVVASRIGGMPEALYPDTHALFFTPGDARGCAAAIAETIRDEAATARRVACARARARSVFSAHGPSMERFLYDAADALHVPATSVRREERK